MEMPFTPKSKDFPVMLVSDTVSLPLFRNNGTEKPYTMNINQFPLSLDTEQKVLLMKFEILGAGLWGGKFIQYPIPSGILDLSPIHD